MQAAATKKQTLVVQMDNSPIHKSKAAIQKIASMRVKVAPHSPYSPDLAPSYFFLFGHIKQNIAGQELLSADDLLEALREEFNYLSRPALENVFDEWLIRLQSYIDYGGPYFSEG
jgi:histone-lysine N-methyltransferase SETMAR